MMMPAMLLVATLGGPQGGEGLLGGPQGGEGLLGGPQEPAAPAPSPESKRTSARPADASADTAGGRSATEEIQAGLQAFARRRFTQARAAFERAVAADPQSAAAHFYLGYTIYKIAEPKRHDSPGKREAAEHFAKAYELDPAFKPVWGGGRG